jgi:hypothetical protein
MACLVSWSTRCPDLFVLLTRWLNSKQGCILYRRIWQHASRPSSLTHFAAIFFASHSAILTETCSCSGQVRALVALGANACIVGRNRDKAEQVAADIATVRAGSTVLGIGDVDVRDPITVQAAVDQCVRQLGGIDFVMQVSASHQESAKSNL